MTVVLTSLFILELTSGPSLTGSIFLRGLLLFTLLAYLLTYLLDDNTHLLRSGAAEYLARFVSLGKRQRHSERRPLAASKPSHSVVRLHDP